MAAEALLGVVFEKSLSLIQNEFATLSGIKENTEKLSSSLALIRAVLEDAEEKQMTDRSVKVWLQQLKDAVYVLDDILDECSIKSHQLHHGLSSFKPNNIIFRHRTGSRLQEISRRFDQIAEAKNKFLLREAVKERPSEVPEWRQTSSIIVQPQVYGRHEDKEKIVEFLLHQAQSSNSLSIYPIVGLGGLGKTTLTQLVYNDQRVSTHFNVKVWICVSENFSVKNILCSIIQSVTKEKQDILDLDVIEKKVQELLQGKRFLLVLDDVWKRNQQLQFGLSQDKSNQLKSVLSFGSKGASILVSTRDEDVATIMGTCQTHHLSGLSEDDCWLLFKQYAFGPDSEENPELVAIGKDIVRKCGGSPLAAQALGGVMRFKNGEKEWLQIKESSLWTLPDENGILPALRLSYFHLQPTLKQCFSFCAIFPKDTRMKKEDLIHLWMANGFISSGQNLEVEDVGNMIWNELYRKSFFQDIETDEESGDISFKMHDLVHDVAQSVIGEECMILDTTNVNNLSRSTHHVAVASGCDLSSETESIDLKKVESLRSLLFDIPTNSCFSSTKHSLRILRVHYSIWLSSLGNFIHLRYLELRGCTNMKTLPNSICNLRKLEILKLIRCYDLSHLPKHLTRLQNLRHIIIRPCHDLSRMFPSVGKLSQLRTLSIYIVSLKRGHSLVELRDLNLGGELRIDGLDDVRSVSEAEAVNLKGKRDLKKLCFSWYESGKTKSDSTKAMQVLEALQPHSNLKSLKVVAYEGLYFPSWMGNDSVLSNLVALELLFCKNCLQVPILGKLPSLRRLEIESMDNVQYMDDDSVHVRPFPSLKKIRLRELPNLERLFKVEKMFPNLSHLSIYNCPKLELPPSLPSLKYLELIEPTNELLRSISNFTGLISLDLSHGSEDLTLFLEGMMTNLTCLKTLQILGFPKLKELPNELMKHNTLDNLSIYCCDDLESLPEHGWEGLRALRTMVIADCGRLRSLPEGIRHLTSLEYLRIKGCPTLKKRCEEGTGEDWHKIAHVPKVKLY